MVFELEKLDLGNKAPNFFPRTWLDIETNYGFKTNLFMEPIAHLKGN